MEHGDYLVKILDPQGREVGSKPRKEVDKVHDIVHCADALIVQNRMMVLAKIPSTTLYGGRLGAPAATMIRVGETPEAALERALADELRISGASPIKLGEKFYIYDDGVKRLKTTFVFDWEGSMTASPDAASGLATFQRPELEEAIRTDPAQFAPTFLALWNDYGKVIPF